MEITRFQLDRPQATIYGIPLLAAYVGESFGRTIHFDVGTGELRIRTINHGEKVI